MYASVHHNLGPIYYGGRVILASELPHYNMFHKKRCMRARVTGGVGLPYQIDRITPAVAHFHVNRALVSLNTSTQFLIFSLMEIFLVFF